MLTSNSGGDSHQFLNIQFDATNKVWKSVNYPYGNVSNRSIGEAFLKSMRSLDPNKVLEYHYDVRREKCVKCIYKESIDVSVNLQRLGLQKGDVVVLFTGYTYMTSALTFGSLMAGAIVNYFEVQLDKEGLDDVMATIQPSIIFYEEIFRHKIQNCLNRIKPVSLKYVFAIDGPDLEVFESEFLKPCDEEVYTNFQPLLIANPEEETAFIVLTSGSTGLPKAIQLSHAAVLNGMYIWWANPENYEPLDCNSLLFSLSPLRWISQLELLMQSAILGIKRICANRAAIGSYGLCILRETQPTHIFSVPSFFYDILLELPKNDDHSLMSLKYIQLGGEFPSEAISEKVRLNAVNARLYYSYGMSEVSGSITNDQTISGGKLQPGYQVQILNENMEPEGYNKNGRLAVRTPYKFLGYKALDNTKYFLPNGFFLNGDYGYFDRNNILHVLARYADLIKIGGVVIIPQVVESLVATVADIKLARLVESAKLSAEKNRVVCLFLTLKNESSISIGDILEKVKQVMRTKLSSQEFDLIHKIKIIDNFPLTTCGKIDRIALSQWAALL
ncbi:putative acyl--CoA ligase YdaB [Musca autumnalis]|uniref:putative acyl--CoA ligase YdaB n=1 Tax=Musca autumnalis TaxID=221902 RepID=UPI003CF64FCD